MKKKAMFLAIIAVLLINIAGIPVIGSNNATNVIVVLYDPTDDVTIEAANRLQNIGSDYGNVQLLSITTGEQLIHTINKLNVPVIYAFHGSSSCWTIAGQQLSVDRIAIAIQESPSPAHFLAACNSMVLEKMVTGKFIGSLMDDFDIEIAMVILDQMMIDYYSTRGFNNQVIKSKQDQLDNYIKENAHQLLNRLVAPERPLIEIYDAYDPSYAGPSGFNGQENIYVKTMSDVTSYAINTALGIFEKFKIVPGLKFSFSPYLHDIAGQAVYTSYYYETISRWERIRWWYSTTDWVHFSYYSIEVGFDFSVTDFLDRNNNDGQGSSSGITFSLKTRVAEPSAAFGGRIKYVSDINTYDPASSSIYQSMVDSWLTLNKEPTGFSGSGYVQVDYGYEVSLKISGQGYTYEGTLLKGIAGVRFDLSISQGLVTIRGLAFALGTVGIDVSFAKLSLNVVVILLGAETEITDAVHLAVYCGADLNVHGEFVGITFLDAHVTIPIIIYNETSKSPTTLVQAAVNSVVS
ncbi:MAG: hypothetical protein ACFFD4_29060 [Candidatus Odinarchaeota archaeon]